MKLLVTGGAGYIGSIITEELLKGNHEVIVFDNLSKGHSAAVPPGAKLIRGDLLNQDDIEAVFAHHRIEAVIHMAALALVGESVMNPRAYYRNNVEAGLRLLNAMVDAEVPRIVFSSTAAVYGEPTKQPVEEQDPTSPTNPYGQTKLGFEEALHWYSKAYGVQYTSLRYFNAAEASRDHGEMHLPETHLIPAILQAAAGKREYVEIYGDDYATTDGTCIRDYIHVVDLAAAHILALESKENDIFNLGCGGAGYSVRQVLNIAKEVTGRGIPHRVVARRSGDPSVLIASSDRIKRQLGWRPLHQDLHKMIESAWVWMKSFPDGYPA